MTLHAFSRRRLLGGLLAGLTAWLCPRPTRAAAPHIPSPTAVHCPDQFGSVTSYTYDAGGEPTYTDCYSYDNENRLRSVTTGMKQKCSGGRWRDRDIQDSI